MICYFGVLLNTFSAIIAHAKTVLRIGVSLFCGLVEPFDSFLQILFNTFTVEITYTDMTLCIGISLGCAAKNLDKPIIVHDRQAHEPTYALLRRYRPRGVLHCYSGSAEDALAFRLCVEDTGPGISPEDLPHVFERFYRGGKGNARSADAGSEVDPAGVGIGLALARSLVTAQGGSIRAGNAASGGARFDVVFFKAVV